MKKLKELLKREVELYKKLLRQNNDILNALNNSDPETTEQKIENKERLLDEIKKIDEILNHVWEKWDEYENKVTEGEKFLIKNLKTIIDENLQIEKIIIDIMENQLEKNRENKLKVSRGKTVLNAYQGIKTSLPYFVNKKG